MDVAPRDGLLAALHAIVGDRGLLTSDADMSGFSTDWRGLYHGRAACVVRPASTAELGRVVAACVEAGGDAGVAALFGDANKLALDPGGGGGEALEEIGFVGFELG